MSTQPTPGATAEACAREVASFSYLWHNGPGKDCPNGTYGENLAAIITRHFAPLLARVAELEKDLRIAHVCIDERDRLRDEVATARRDTERIDWLEKEKVALVCLANHSTGHKWTAEFETVRAAIDAALHPSDAK